ncbi:MAG: hypothetical protein AAB152_11960 [Candidatus Coatesbacteria bacterium]
MTREEWTACEDGALMLSLLGKAIGPAGSDERRRLVLAACACARRSLQHVPTHEDRPRIAIEAAERWAKEIGGSLDQVRRAARDAEAFAAGLPPLRADAEVPRGAASGSAAAIHGVVAAAAASAAYTATESFPDLNARAAATEATRAAAAFAAVTIRETAHAVELRHCADIVRHFFPNPPATVAP